MSPADPAHAASLLARLANAQSRFVESHEERRRAIVEAVQGGVSLRDVAEAAACSHESVRRIVAADGTVTLELDGKSFQLTDQQIEMLIYKLDGMAKGAFPGDLQLLAVGNEWLPYSRKLADAFQLAREDENGQPVVLDEGTGYALFQILRLTYFGGRTVLSELFDALLARYGHPHVIAELSRSRPRKR
jgi:hypothetical protein